MSCVGRGLAMGRSAVQGFPPECLNLFMVSEVRSASEEAKGPNP